MRKNSILIILITICIIGSPVFADVNKHISLRTGYSYLLIFDGKIIKYTTGNNKAIKTELMTNIFNNKQELLIKPLLAANTNILIWTDSNIYNFDISIDKEDVNIPNIVNFPEKNNTLSQKLKDSLDDLSIDEPPQPDQNDVFSFEIDQPPKFTKKTTK